MELSKSYITWHMRKQIEFVQNPDWFAKLYFLPEINEFFKDHGLGAVPHCNRSGDKFKIQPTEEIVEWVKEAYKEDYELIASIKPEHRTL